MLRRLIDSVDKPEYLFCPRTISRRYKTSKRRVAGGEMRARLPWGAEITVDANDVIGYSILALGVYDLTVTEILARLVSAGETCIDAGANIGQMCSMMALRSGSSGYVIAFEPYGRMYERLSKNVFGWQRELDVARIDLRKCALSSSTGNGVLSIPENIDRNAGLASLVPRACGTGCKQDVVLTTLDATIGGGKVEVLKLDVEGHELAVLGGGSAVLGEHRIRDIVFEEHAPFPSPVHRKLQQHGYTIYRISRTLFGPVLKEPRYRSDHFRDALPNYLATVAPERASALIRPRKWLALSDSWVGTVNRRAAS
jgi:FkbM family methyltransferase